MYDKVASGRRDNTSELELTISQTRYWAGSLSILKHGNPEDIVKCGIPQNWFKDDAENFSSAVSLWKLLVPNHGVYILHVKLFLENLGAA